MSQQKQHSSRVTKVHESIANEIGGGVNDFLGDNCRRENDRHSAAEDEIDH